MSFSYDGVASQWQPVGQRDAQGRPLWPKGHIFGLQKGQASVPGDPDAPCIPDERPEGTRIDTEDFPLRSQSHEAARAKAAVTAMCFAPDKSRANFSLFVGYANGMLDCVMVRAWPLYANLFSVCC